MRGKLLGYYLEEKRLYLKGTALGQKLFKNGIKGGRGGHSGFRGAASLILYSGVRLFPQTQKLILFSEYLSIVEDKLNIFPLTL